MRFVLLGVGIVAVIVLGGMVVLGTMDVPPPTKTIEKAIPNDRFKP